MVCQLIGEVTIFLILMPILAKMNKLSTKNIREKRAAYKVERLRRLEKQNQLTDAEKTAVDHRFYATLNEIVRTKNGARLKELATLCEKGAALKLDIKIEEDCFYNPTELMRLWCRSHSENATLWKEVIVILLKSGPAFVNYQGDHGNGQETALYSLFSWINNAVEDIGYPKIALAANRQQLENKAADLEEILVALLGTANSDSVFWENLLVAFMHFNGGWPMRNIQLPKEGLEIVACLSFFLLENKDPEIEKRLLHSLENDFYLNDHATRYSLELFAGMCNIKCLEEIILQIVLSIEKAPANSKLDRLPLALLFEEQVVKKFFRGKQSRKTLVQSFKISKKIRTAFCSNSNNIFLLAKNKEREILLALLKNEGKKIRALRNAKNQSLLLYACSCRGCNHLMIEDLLIRGFDPREKDTVGENAFEIAARLKNDKVLQVLEDFRVAGKG